MKIGMMGLGMVGGTFKEWLEKNTRHELLFFDPAKDLYNSMEEAEVVFVSVPAPAEDRYCDVHLETIKSCLRLVPKTVKAVFIRSTVSPGSCDELTFTYGIPVYSMPEFLTERTAEEDMNKLDIMTGCQDRELLELIFNRKKNFILLSNTEAEYTKLSHNALGALKVHFFNEMYNYCENKKLHFPKVREAMMGITGFFSEQHTMVPGPDGQRGFGGMCFPKDLKLWSQTTESLKRTFEEILTRNENFRKKEVLPQW